MRKRHEGRSSVRVDMSGVTSGIVNSPPQKEIFYVWERTGDTWSFTGTDTQERFSDDSIMFLTEDLHMLILGADDTEFEIAND